MRQMIVATALSLVLAATAAKAQQNLVIVATGGAFEKALDDHFYKPFTAETGIKIAPVASGLGPQWAKAQAMVEAKNVEWDIVSAFAEDALDKNRDLLEKLDCTRLPSAQKDSLPGTCGEHLVLRTIGAGVLTWNTKTFADKQPKSWADFWDVKNFPGPRSLPSTPSAYPWLLMVALIADGVPADKLFPLDMDRAFRKLEEIKPHVSVWWTTGDQSQAAMRDGEAVMALMWSSRAIPSIKSGMPLKFTYADGIRNIAYWAILKDAPHKEAAYRFLDFYLKNPQEHAAFGRKLGTDTPNMAVAALLSKEERAFVTTTPENWSRTVAVDEAWAAANTNELTRRMLAFLSK